MRHLVFGILVLVGMCVSAQSNTFTITYDGISPSKNSPHEKEKSGNIGIQNPERGFSVRAGLMDIYADQFPWDVGEAEFYEDLSGDSTKGIGVESVENYLKNFSDDGISLVELEHYVHFSEDNLENKDPLNENHLAMAKNVVFDLKEHGVKTHLIMNSSFNFFSNGSDYNEVGPNSKRTKGLEHYMEEMSGFYEEISPMVAVAHLGWMYSPWDFNSYRLSNKWKNQNYDVWKVYPVGDVPLVPYEGYEEIANYHGENRESVQRTDWGAYHGSGGGPWNLKSDINRVRKVIIDNVLDYFPYQKVITNSTFPWTNYIGTSMGGSKLNNNAVDRTYMGRYAPGNHSFAVSSLKDGNSYSRIGYYDEAFAGDSYSHGWSIPDGEVHQIHWHKGYKKSNVTLGSDWKDNKYYTDAFVLRKYRHNFWMHGELPVFETPDPIENVQTNPWSWSTSSFTQHHSYFQNWYPNPSTGERNHTFDFEIGEGISSGKLQNGLMSALKLRYFNFTSFSIAHNNLLDGRSPYEMYDGYDIGLSGSGIPTKDSTAVSRWKTMMLSPSDLSKFQLPISDKYFEGEDGNLVNRSAYEYIRDHLGYRLELQESTFEKGDQELNVTTKIINRGFAAPQNPRRIYYVLLNEENEVIDQVLLGDDWRAWQPDDFAVAHDNETNLDYSTNFSSLDDVKVGGIPLGDFNSNWHHTPLEKEYTPNIHGIQASFSLEGLEDGEYKVGLSLPDINEELFDQPEDYAIKFANSTPFMDCSGITILGAIQIGGGDLDSDADGISDDKDAHPFNPMDFVENHSGPMEKCSKWLNIPIIDLNEVEDIETVDFSDLKVYPNPSKGIFNLSFSGMVAEVNIEIFNILGQRVFDKGYLGVDDINLDLNNLETGTYIVNVSGPNHNQVIKLIKE